MDDKTRARSYYAAAVILFQEPSADDCKRAIELLNEAVAFYPDFSEASIFCEEVRHYLLNMKLEDRIEIGRKVAVLRINAEGSKGMAWRKIREKLGLKNDEFHKGIRLEDHFKESVVERIESFEGGWECQGDLTYLCGFEPTGEWLDRIEACKPRKNNKGRRFL